MTDGFLAKRPGKGDGTGVFALPSLGVPFSAQIARWDADTYRDSYVGAWRAARTDHVLAGAAAAIATANGHRYAVFDGVDDYVNLAASGLGIKTVAALVRSPVAGAAGSFLSYGGTYVRPASNGSLLITGGTAQSLNPTRSLTKWNWLFVSLDAGARTVAVNAQAAVTGTGGQSISKIEIGRDIEGGNYGGNPLHVAQVVAFNRVLSSAERAAMWANLQATRPEWAA